VFGLGSIQARRRIPLNLPSDRGDLVARARGGHQSPGARDALRSPTRAWIAAVDNGSSIGSIPSDVRTATRVVLQTAHVWSAPDQCGVQGWPRAERRRRLPHGWLALPTGASRKPGCVRHSRAPRLAHASAWTGGVRSRDSGPRATFVVQKEAEARAFASVAAIAIRRKRPRAQAVALRHSSRASWPPCSLARRAATTNATNSAFAPSV
jgi:hypothetical protein